MLDEVGRHTILLCRNKIAVAHLTVVRTKLIRAGRKKWAARGISSVSVFPVKIVPEVNTTTGGIVIRFPETNHPERRAKGQTESSQTAKPEEK